ncbi:MAG: glycosyltransferase [Sporomusaceae bacterium]|nr:glycosyltransferase [Sporomusaceae bacterium]
MFFSYTVSVILLALALYGLWQMLRDVSEWLILSERLQPPSLTIVLFVRDGEGMIEGLLAALLLEFDKTSREVELVVVDGGSKDLTVPIILRIGETRFAERLLLVHGAFRGIQDWLPLCRGDTIHFFDLVHRTKPSVCIALVHRILTT